MRIAKTSGTIGIAVGIGLAIASIAVFAQTTAPDAVWVRLIVAPSEEQANRLLDQLRAGADFAVLAREKSIDATSVDGGLLGKVDPPSLRVELRDGLKGVEPGHFSSVVKLPSGYAILKVLPAAEIDSRDAADRNRQAAVAAFSSVQIVADVDGLREALASLFVTPKPADWQQSLAAIRDAHRDAWTSGLDYLKGMLDPNSERSLDRSPARTALLLNPPETDSMSKYCFISGILLGALALHAAQRFSVTGVILETDPAHRSFTASCTAIPGYMEAMVMPYSVQDDKQLKGIEPGMVVDFTLVVTDTDSYAENLRIHRYLSMEQEPVEVRSLQILSGAVRPDGGPPRLALGDPVPDFTLTDQASHPVSLSQFAGKVVVAAFIYTSCPLPNYCFRLSNNLGRLQKRFAGRLGGDLVLLSVTMDPVHDTPEVMAKYATTWKADTRGWHFLTGPPADVTAVCHRFGVDFWLGEGSLTHSLHTVVIDRRQKLAANFEGNEFTAEQLGDFVETELASGK